MLMKLILMHMRFSHIRFLFEPITEPINIQSTSLNPLIKVGNIDILGLSAGAVVHIGSSEHIQMEVTYPSY